MHGKHTHYSSVWGWLQLTPAINNWCMWYRCTSDEDRILTETHTTRQMVTIVGQLIQGIGTMHYQAIFSSTFHMRD